MVFPAATHARHLVTILQVQELLRQRTDAEQVSNVSMAKAVNRLAREHEKSRKADDRQETSSDDEVTNKWAYDHYESMRQYNLQKVPQPRSLNVEKQEKYAKRAAVGVLKRGPYLVPGETTEFTPTWMKTPLPSKVEELPTHAHWVAAYWSKALTQISTQGHTHHQTLSVEQLLTQFLNINRV